MLRLIAHDLTGAAEVGGVAWRYHLTAEVQLDAPQPTTAAVRIVDTDTRGRAAGEAAARVRAAGPVDFKKVDSVLRGPVLAELEALGAARIVLLPCNPSLGRTIRNGQYSSHGIPIHETDFRNDPLHPIRSSRVEDMLGGPLPSNIILGEAETHADLLKWIHPGTLPAGGAEFFAAFLESRGLVPRSVEPFAPQGRLLILCGSAHARSREQIAELQRRGIPAVPAPQAFETLERHGRALVAGRVDFADLVQAIAPLTDEIWIEGGATASSIARRMRWTRLEVRRERAPGVVSLQPLAAPSPLLTLKPGSYDWSILHETPDPAQIPRAPGRC